MGLKHLLGKDGKTTAPFHISGSKWRVHWTVEAEEPEYAMFDFWVYPKGETVGYVEHISQDGVGGDTTYIYEGNGSFYIKVFAVFLKRWTIKLEDCITAAAAPPPPPAPTPTPTPEPSPELIPPPSPPAPPPAPARGGGFCGC